MISPLLLARKAKIRTQVQDQLTQHGIEGWYVDFERSTDRAGNCNYTLKRIMFSSFFLENADETEIQNIVTHELAHAIAENTFGEKGHGEAWAEQHRALGGSGNAFALTPQNVVNHDNFLWIGVCPSCNHRTGIEEAPTDVWACVACEAPKLQRIFEWFCDGDARAPEEISETYGKMYAEVMKNYER